MQLNEAYDKCYSSNESLQKVCVFSMFESVCVKQGKHCICLFILFLFSILNVTAMHITFFIDGMNGINSFQSY